MSTLASHNTCHLHALKLRLILRIDDVEVCASAFLGNVNLIGSILIINYCTYLSRIPELSNVIFIFLVVWEISAFADQ